MTIEQYHFKYFPSDTKWRQIGIRAVAISRLEGVFGCPERPMLEAVASVEIASLSCGSASWHVLLGAGHDGKWHELAVCRDKSLLSVWRDVNYAL